MIDRNQQIREAAYNEYDGEYHSDDNFSLEMACFKDGARWADSHPASPSKDIEERAKAILENYDFDSSWTTQEFKQEMKKSLIEIATEQKAIDDADLKIKLVGAHREGRSYQLALDKKTMRKMEQALIDKARAIMENYSGAYEFEDAFGKSGWYFDTEQVIDIIHKTMEE